MTLPLEEYGIDVAALAADLKDTGSHSRRYLVINDNLLDVRPWARLDEDEIIANLRADPLGVLAAWELTSAAEALRKYSISDNAFLKMFTTDEITLRMVYLGMTSPPETPPDIPAIVHSRYGGWDSLLFLQLVIRWALRFGHLQPYDRKDFVRLNLQYPFATAVVESGLPGKEQLVHNLLEELGIEVIYKDEAVAGHHLAAWFSEQLHLKSRSSKAKQTRLDFREAGGTRNSLFVVRAMGGVDGYDVRGTVGEDLGLIIDIGDKEISVASTAYIERHVVKIINENTPLSAELVNDSLKLRWYDTRLGPEDLGRIIHEALKNEFILGIVSVNIIFDPLRIASIKASIYAYIDDRAGRLERRTEERAPFVVCTDCKSYAPHAFCVISSDRPPCCGRSFDELATLAQLTRGSMHMTIDKGICQDRSKGSYIGADKSSRIYSEGNITQINLHSIREHPHPTTAIPQCVAYYMDELDIIIILSRDYTGRSPDGKTFDSLLARVAGRQTPGYIGISEGYVLSGRFFAHQGGLSRVGWMNSSLMERLKLKVEHIATEKDCINTGGLKDFMAAWRR